MCYLGDDDTDEEAFEALQHDDVAVRIGPGRTAAHVRLGDPAAAVGFLSRLAVGRREAMTGGRPYDAADRGPAPDDPPA